MSVMHQRWGTEELIIMELEEEQKSVTFQSSKMAVRGRGDCSSKITVNGKKTNKQKTSG